MTRAIRRHRSRVVLALTLLWLPLGGCASLRRVAVRSLAKSLASGGSVWSADDDPQLVREALPFTLKTVESLLASDPRNPDLLLAAASGFTQYAYAFLETDTLQAEAHDPATATAASERTRRMYVRARDYALRGLELAHPGIGDALRQEPSAAGAACTVSDVPFLYWAGASWGAAISAGKDHPELLADLPAVRALLERGLALHEDFQAGALHAALLSLDALSPMMGGNPQRAKQHYERALALSGGRDASLFVTWAASVAVATQDRAGFDAALASALAIDPDAFPANRLSNLVAQHRARLLQGRAEDLFL